MAGMAGMQGDSNDLESLKKKLEAVRETLSALSPGELRALIENPNLLGNVFGAPRQTDLTDLDQKVRNQIDMMDAPVSSYVSVVQFTKEQLEEARRLQMEIWKKQGIADEMIALAQLRGKRIDPFVDEDPEPTSEEAK